MGRRLASYNGNTFKYNADGKRIEKNGIKYYYDSQGRLVKQSNRLEFLYDTTGLFGFKYFRAYYIYKKDIQGNIVGILNDFGREVVTYSYDAWGNFKIGGNPEYADIAELNPFRYRGYYYDVETGLYYLQSRYYDPELGRFMTLDSIEYADSNSINGLNLYAYCGNNPVKYADPTGHYVVDDISNLTDYFQIFFMMSYGALLGLSKNAPNLTKSANAFVSQLGKFGNSISSTLSTVGYGLIVVSNIINGKAENKSNINIITDSIFDCAAIAVATEIGVAVGSIIPGIGTGVGAVVGLSLGVAYSWFESSPVIQGLKEAFCDGVETIVNDVVNAVNKIGDFLDSAYQSVKNWFSNLAWW